MIVFDDEVRDHMAPTSRHGQLMRLLHALERIELGVRTDFEKPFLHFQEFLSRPGIVVVISDFYQDPALVVKTIEPLRYRGNELILFHVLDPAEIAPEFPPADAAASTWRAKTPWMSRRSTRRRSTGLEIDSHIQDHRRPGPRRAGMEYFLLDTSRPLDQALREFLVVREGRM